MKERRALTRTVCSHCPALQTFLLKVLPAAMARSLLRVELALLALLAIASLSATAVAADDLSARPPFIAAFLANSSREWLVESFSGLPLPCPLVRSDAEYRGNRYPITSGFLAVPGGAEPMQSGQNQAAQLIAFVRDTHVQSVLLAQAISANMYSSLLTSSRTYPQVTLSRSAPEEEVPDLWTEVDMDAYSEALWARLEDGGYISVERDPRNTDFAGRVKSVKLTGLGAALSRDGGKTFTTTLPATLFRPATEVTVEIIQQAEAPVTFVNAAVCAASGWNMTTGKCTLPAGGSTPEPLFGFFPTLARTALLENVVENTCTQGWDVLPRAQAMFIDRNASAHPIEKHFEAQPQRYGMWFYARDEHASAVLLALRHHANEPQPLYTKEPFCQTTITCMDDSSDGGLYDESYGQVLWQRLVDARLVVVQRDSEGHMIGAQMGPAAPKHAKQVQATLPAYPDPRPQHAGQGIVLRETNVWLLLLNNTYADGRALEATVCQSDQWDAAKRVCNASGGGGDSGNGDDGDSMAHKLAVGLGVGGGVLLTCLLVGLCIWCKRRSTRAPKTRHGGTLDDQLNTNTHYVPLDI